MVQFADHDPADPRRRRNHDRRQRGEDEHELLRLDRLIRDLAILLVIALMTMSLAVYARSSLAFVAALAMNLGGLLYLTLRHRSNR